ncbi:MAG: carboxypeptidase regulatory-like domain-containing protein [Myxococcaceae bacterium]
MRNSSLALVAALAVGCSQPPPADQVVNNINTESNVAPTGTLQGRVTDSTTGEPLGGVAVSTLAGAPVSATTDPNGAWVLPLVPAGTTYTLTFDLAGYVRSVATAYLESKTGDFPTGNAVTTRNVVLAKGTAEVRGYVFAAQGRTAAGATVVADLRDLGFDLVVSTKVAADGTFKLTGLPGFAAGLTIPLVVPPYDENADGVPDYAAAARTVAVFSGATSFAVISIAASGAAILSTNLSDGQLLVGEPITVVFTAQMSPGETTATLRNVSRAVDVAVVQSWDAARLALTVKTSGDAPLGAGQRYQLNLQARAQNGAWLMVGIPFQVLASPVPPITRVLTNLKVESPASPDWNTTSYVLSWDPATEAAAYRAYAHDSATNPSWVLLGTVGTSPAPLTTVLLPAAFDTYSGDLVRTPLAFGTSVTLAVVPVDVYGNESPLPSAASVVVKDTARPAAVETQVGNANNQGSTSETIELRLDFSEYMDNTVAPTITLPATGMTSTWTWDRSLLQGKFDLTVPANSDRRGPFTVSGAKDTNGNTMVDLTGTLTGQQELIVNGTFEGTPCSLTGWAATTQIGGNTPTFPAPIAQSARSRTGSCAAQAGVAATGTAAYGSSVLSQQLSVPAGASKVDLVLWYQVTTDRPFSCFIRQRCDLYDAAGTAFLANVFGQADCGAVRNNWTRVNLDLLPYASQTVTLSCETANLSATVASRSALYLDDVSVIAR